MSPFNGHTKWVVGIVSSAVVGLAIWGVTNDRNGFERRLTAVEGLSTALAISRAQSSQQLEEIQKSLKEIKEELKDAREREALAANRPARR